MSSLPELKGKTFDEACELVLNEKGIQCSAHKKPPGVGSKWSFCLSFTPSDYSEMELLETLAAEFGPGDYPVQFRTPGDKGPPVVRWSQQFAVEARRISAAQRESAKPEPGRDAVAIAIEGQTALLAAILEKVSQPPPAPAAPPTIVDFAKDLGALKDLFGGGASPLEMMKDAMELKKLITDDDKGVDDDPLTLAFKHFIPEIAEGVKALRETEPAARPNPKQERREKRGFKTDPPKPKEDLREAAHAEDAADPERDIETQTRLAFEFFAQKFLTPAMQLAESGEDPQHVGYYLARVIGGDQNMLHLVGLVLSQDDMVERLAEFNDEIMQHAAWLDKVGDWLAHALWPDANDAPEVENATSSATHGENRDSRDITGGEPGEGPNGDGSDVPPILSEKPKSDGDLDPPAGGPANDP